MSYDDLADELGDGRGISYVAGDEVVGVLLGRRAAAGDDRGAGRAVGVGDATAQPTGPAGDEDDAAGQVGSQRVAPASSSAMAVTARWPKAMAGVMHAPGPG